jgi:glycosyltransferase involved in cell wall biosynthesis
MTIRVKLFLGAYVNITNAQNLNCLALAKYLDKSQFDITVLSLYSQPPIKIEGVKLYRCVWPHRILVYWAYFWNIVKADVVYLPKAELLGFNSFICKLFGKKSFSTIEGILDDTNFLKAKNKSGFNVLNYYDRLSQVFSISQYIKDYNFKKHGLITENKILELGTESKLFISTTYQTMPITKVILIANNYSKKGVDHFLALANEYSQLEFHLVGAGKKIENHLPNLIYHRKLSQYELSELLKDMQLHILPSRSEGFPKVILETACAGVPSLVYADYGADQWIDHYQNGFVVQTLDEMKVVIEDLLNNKVSLNQVSKNAIQLGLSYDWKLKIKAWQEVILALSSK